MSKINEALVMMAEQKETFEVNGKKFQVIEVKDAEQQPDYSHLVGKWVRCTVQEDKQDSNPDMIRGKYYPVTKIDYGIIFIKDEVQNYGWTLSCINTIPFDLSNPSDTNPDEKKKILVPKEVQILNWFGLLGIGFGDHQWLYILKGTHSYSVAYTDVCEPIQFELIKCERSELKKGDVAFRTNIEAPSFSFRRDYCIIIDSERCCFIQGNEDIATSRMPYEHWYKVVPIQSTNK